MRRICSIALLALSLASLPGMPARAEDKIVERSAKKTPEWLATAQEDFLIVTVVAPSLADAQKQALNEVTERIIRSVASNVSVSENMELAETVVNGTVESSIDSYRSTSQIRAANLPFLKGISLSKVTDVYWVKLQDKQTKALHYEYSIKYPYSSLDQRKLQTEFEKLDAEKSAELAALEEDLRNITSLDDISKGVATADALIEYFFDNVRSAKAKSLRIRYNELYKTIGIIGSVTGNGTAECALSVNGKAVRCGLVPTVTSNCASGINVAPTDGTYRITYDTSDCLSDEENFLQVTFRVHGKRIEHRMLLNGEAATAGKFSVVPEGKVNLTSDSVSVERGIALGMNIRLSLNNRGTTDFGVKSLELNVPGIVAPIIIDDIDAVYTSRGVVQIECQVIGDIKLSQAENATSRMLSGRIMLVNPISGSVVSTRLSLPFTKNW